MSSKSMAEVQIETAETLENIAMISRKIKQKLEIIKEITREDGPLNDSINNFNLTLGDILRKRGVKVDELLEVNEKDETDLNQTVPLTVDAITQKLMNFVQK